MYYFCESVHIGQEVGLSYKPEDNKNLTSYKDRFKAEGLSKIIDLKIRYKESVDKDYDPSREQMEKKKETVIGIH